MKWKKLGLVFCPSGEMTWMQSHAAVPIAKNVDGNIFKFYFSTRDSENRSFTGYVVVNLERPNKIIELSNKPVLSPRALGEFDDSGSTATWLTSRQGGNY